MEISSSKVNIMLNVAYANESGLTIYGYEDDYVVPVTDEKSNNIYKRTKWNN